jgi:para-nitrobenzyl esterase
VTSQDQGGPFYQTTVLGSQLPNIDGYVIGSSLREAFTAGVYSPRPLLLGTNKDEGTLFHAPIYALAITDEAHYRAALGTRFGSANVDAIEAKYPPTSFPTPNDALAAVTGDAFFVCPARAAARGAALAGSTVFRYSFEQPLTDPFTQGLGVFHSSELPFVFGNDTFPLGHIGDATSVAEAMQTYWTTFAKQGDPNDASVAPWPAYDPATDPYLTIDGAPHASSALKSALCDFWDALPPP